MRRVFLSVVTVFALLTIALLLPVFPWAAHFHHKLERVAVKAEMQLAKWRGVEPRLISLSGRVDLPGAQIQALDSHSGWAALADREGRFKLPGVMWYPGAEYELVVSAAGLTGVCIEVSAPDEYPANGTFEIAELNLSGREQVEMKDLKGLNGTGYEDFDTANLSYYEDLFFKVTAEKQTDEDIIDAINEFVSQKLNYAETQWELGSPKRVLERGSQYCGHLASAMATLLEAGGYETRTINISDDRDPPNTHVVVEVFYKGKWHLYDPTFGVKFRDKDGQVVSYRDLRLGADLVTEDLFFRLKPQDRRKLLSWLPSAYSSGFYRLYYLRRE